MREDIGRHELNYDRHHVALDKQTDLLQAAARGHVDAPLSVVLIFIFNVYFQDALEKQVDQVVLAVLNIVLDDLALTKTVSFLLRNRGPELNALGTNTRLVVQCSLSSHRSDFLEVVLDVKVLFTAYLDKALHGFLANIELLVLESFEDLVHYEVSLCCLREVLGRVRNRMVQSVDCQAACLVEIFSIGDVVGQSKHDLVLELRSEVIGVKVFTDVANCLERSQSDLHLVVLRILTQAGDQVGPLTTRDFDLSDS